MYPTFHSNMVDRQIRSDPCLWLTHHNDDNHPKTGLDAANAHHIVQLLKDLAGEGHTVVVAIHTPRPEIWELFDHILLLSQGHVLYNGTTSSVHGYFEQCGHAIPASENPAEHLIDLVSIEAEGEASPMGSVSRINNLKDQWKATQCTVADSYAAYSSNGSVVRYSSSISRHPAVPLSRQLAVLTRRTIRDNVKGPYEPQRPGNWSRQGALFALLNIYGYPMLIYVIYRLSCEIQMFDREPEEGVDIPGPAISSIVFYFLVGLWRSVAEPFLFLLVMILGTYISLAVAVLAIAISRDFAIAGLIGNLIYTLQSLSGAHNFSLYSAVCAIEFVGPKQTPPGHLYGCSSVANSPTVECTESYGKDIMASLGFPREWIWQPVVASLGFLVSYTLVAALILQRPRIGAIMSSDPQSSRSSVVIQNIELLPLSSTPYIPGVDIQLMEYGLSLIRRNTKAFLSPRSGKTTLLHAITARFPKRYRRRGQVLYNSHRLPPSTIRAMCPYLSQSDYLQPFLAVRETLLFAAGLRLPRWITKEQRYSKVDSIIRTMGLTSCAETIVGDEKQKGISGSEKRRVSIGIQLLTDPRILILDEPTSGLDAYTAGCILKKLKNLSEEGRTVICSIHQPRSDIFPFFSNILLLTSDGSPVFTGPGEDILHYFHTHGFDYPDSMNPCDVIIDLVPVDHRDNRETSGRARVQQLIDRHAVTQPTIQDTPPLSMTLLEQRTFAKNINSFQTLFPLALRRSALGLIRRPFLLLSRLVQAPGMAITFGMFTTPLSSDSNSVQTRIGLLQSIIHERKDGCMTATCFLVQYTCLELPTEIFTSLVSGAIFTFGPPIKRTFTMFLVSSFNIFAILNCGESLGIILLSFFDNIGISATLAPIVLYINWLFAGLLSTSLPRVFQIVSYILPSKYAMADVVPYAMDGLEFTCSEEQQQSTQCSLRNGKDVLYFYNFENNPGLNIMGLASDIHLGYTPVIPFINILTEQPSLPR
ncbi:hypothetical protein BDV33DRAFT_186478 [Aspergillus novoparasiticus]|uniref:ABC transporter domain-containing protein n=1 Tax=Aspergillus novoparasiticus TaxID=986946 RepID=A0A5N6FBW5_9EURO|nr:hypothetical protein BDV33DRAFT_186478 [Aspergillus novoparasiticus]